MNEVREVKKFEGIAAPSNGRMLILSAWVDESRDWNQAVSAAGPDNDERFNIYRVGDQFPPKPEKASQKTIILVNFGMQKGSKEPAVWRDKHKLVNASPRACFAVGKQYPNLHNFLGAGNKWVNSLEECEFDGERRCTDIAQDGEVRQAGLALVRGDWSANDWFAFVKA